MAISMTSDFNAMSASSCSSRARRALESGCDGVVASGLELPAMRSAVDRKLLVVTPGIRPVDNRPEDDQKTGL